jgi:hypothetical protein
MDTEKVERPVGFELLNEQDIEGPSVGRGDIASKWYSALEQLMASSPQLKGSAVTLDHLCLELAWC